MEWTYFIWKDSKSFRRLYIIHIQSIDMGRKNIFTNFVAKNVVRNSWLDKRKLMQQINLLNYFSCPIAALDFLFGTRYAQPLKATLFCLTAIHLLPLKIVEYTSFLAF